MKRKFVKVMFFGALALSTVTYVGCKDYDDDIDNLQTQIDAVKVSLEELQTKVNSGSVITNVVKGDYLYESSGFCGKYCRTSKAS